LLIVLVIILVAAKTGGFLATRTGQPAVLGELLAGLLLGPTAIDLFDARFMTDPAAEDAVHFIADIGVIFLMFLAGLEVDVAEVRAVRRVAIFAGTLGVLFPIALGYGAAAPFGFSTKEALFIGIVLSATSVSISARALMDIGQLRGREGIAVLAAAVIDDVLVLLVLSFFVAFAVGGAGASDGIEIVGRVALFFAVALIAGRFLLPSAMRWVARAPVSEGPLTAAVIFALLYAWFGEYVGEVSLVTGAFLAGALLRHAEFHETVAERVDSMAHVFFVPVFFVAVGMSVDARGLDWGDAGLLAALSLVAVVSKLAGCGLGAYLAGEPLPVALRVGVAMISRGEVGLIVASVGLAHTLIDRDTYSVVVLAVFITTLITPPLLKRAFAKRSLPQIRGA
jgi:Kef-type K+ transport system membrane component KefB